MLSHNRARSFVRPFTRIHDIIVYTAEFYTPSQVRHSFEALNFGYSGEMFYIRYTCKPKHNSSYIV